MQAACRQQQAGLGCPMHTRQPVLSAHLPRLAAPTRLSHGLICHAKQQKGSQTTEQRTKQAPTSLNGKQGTIQPREEQVNMLKHAQIAAVGVAPGLVLYCRVRVQL